MTLTNPAAFFDAMRQGILGEAADFVPFPRQRRFRQIAFSRAPVRKFARRRRDSRFQVNSASKALVQGSSPDAILATGFCEASETLAGYDHGAEVALALRSLLETCGPAAVAGSVIASWVEPVDRVIGRRLLSHVGEEGREGTVPRLRNPNANCPIFSEVLALRVGAAPLDTKPSPIGRAGASFLVPVNEAAVRVSHVTCISGTAK